MKTYSFATSKEVLWDTSVAQNIHNLSLRMHEPIRKGSVLNCGEKYEGEHCGYGQIIFDGEKYRLYYRGSGANDGVWQTEHGDHGLWCVAYSYDGKTFEKPCLELFEYNGSAKNNIVMKLDGEFIDNFSIFLDSAPHCPTEEKYKALMGVWAKEGTYLRLYTSADGLSFKFARDMDVRGKFDSLNICFWDENIQKYRLYLRDYHALDQSKRIDCETETHVRDIQVAFSEDFLTWSAPSPLDYRNSRYEFQLYTNNIQRYPDTDIFIGMPTRYVDRSADAKNYRHLPDLLGFRPMLTEKYGRTGTAITEAMLMTSRDGICFDRTQEAFYTPGIENGENWAYGDGYFAYGMIKTSSDFAGEPDEISLYVTKGYRSRPVNFERYTVRDDGFFSWHADFEGGWAITKPFIFDGSELHLNFATSALGQISIEILDEHGNAVDGYSSGRLFGNSTDRLCEFDKPLSCLAGRPVCFRITMRDADLYSFRFV
ncbi:MAG: hypothetical protein J6L85_00260 [Clostridia bacterium]|nr:hypothetical protein [Clostridia bacterium]